jgi:hypothetical protein
MSEPNKTEKHPPNALESVRRMPYKHMHLLISDPGSCATASEAVVRCNDCSASLSPLNSYHNALRSREAIVLPKYPSRRTTQKALPRSLHVLWTIRSLSTTGETSALDFEFH